MPKLPEECKKIINIVRYIKSTQLATMKFHHDGLISIIQSKHTMSRETVEKAINELLARRIIRKDKKNFLFFSRPILPPNVIEILD